MNGLVKGVVLGVSALLVSLGVAQEFTCIPVNTVAMVNYEGAECQQSCRNDTNCVGLYFDRNIKECTLAMVNSGDSSKICMKTRKLTDGTLNATLDCNSGEHITLENTDENACDQLCVGNQTKGYLYDSQNSSCLAIRRNPIGGLYRNQLCHVVSKFQEAHENRCPCFTQDDLNSIIIKSVEPNNAITSTSCAHNTNNNGMHLRYSSTVLPPYEPIGYASDALGVSPQCNDGHNVKSTTHQQASACLDLLREACNGI